MLCSIAPSALLAPACASRSTTAARTTPAGRWPTRSRSPKGAGASCLLAIEPAEPAHADLAAALGMTCVRELLQLRRPLPLPPDVRPRDPMPYAARAFVPGRDDEQWLDVNNRAFAWHPEQGGWTLDVLHAKEAEPWFDAEGFLVTELDGRLAGFCWTKIHDDTEPMLGEIFVIAVDPTVQARGLGRFLTIAGLDWLTEQGITEGMLYVESDNDPARALYDDARVHDASRQAMVAIVTGRYDVSREKLAEHLPGQPRYRVDQVWAGLYQRANPIEEITELPKALRAELALALPDSLTPVSESVSDRGETVKWLWALNDDAHIETVLMHYRDRSTVCVSTQAGCAMACGFCATGQAGFERNLTTGEIVEQVIRGIRRAAPRRVSNVVFMGMGEPMANYDRMWSAVERLHGDVGISARHLTVSTVGVIPGIRRLATEALPVNLAVSLHAANDDLRNELVPINRRYPLAALTDACRDYLSAKNRRLSFEWALDRRDQRPVAGCPRARRCRPAAGCSREPDPAQSDAGLPHAWFCSRRRVAVPRSTPHVGGERDRSSEPGHRHRRRVRPAPSDDRQRTNTVIVELTRIARSSISPLVTDAPSHNTESTHRAGDHAVLPQHTVGRPCRTRPRSPPPTHRRPAPPRAGWPRGTTPACRNRRTRCRRPRRRASPAAGRGPPRRLVEVSRFRRSGPARPTTAGGWR